MNDSLLSQLAVNINDTPVNKIDAPSETVKEATLAKSNAEEQGNFLLLTLTLTRITIINNYLGANEEPMNIDFTADVDADSTR